MEKEVKERDTAKKVLDKAVVAAAKVIATAADEASRKIAVAAVEAHKVIVAATVTASLTKQSSSDHDLLTELNEKVENLCEDIRKLGTDYSKRVTELENTRVKTLDFEKLKDEVQITREARLRNVENKAANFLITLGIYTVINLAMIGLLCAHIFKT